MSQPRAGHSGTPLVRKLGVKEGHRLTLIHAPEDWEIDDLPPGVSVTFGKRVRRADVVIAFFRQLTSLQHEVPRLSSTIFPDGGLWVAWPRRPAGRASDITDNAVRAVAIPLGLVDVKVAALDEHWSGLKVVWRKELRGGPTNIVCP